MRWSGVGICDWLGTLYDIGNFLFTSFKFMKVFSIGLEPCYRPAIGPDSPTGPQSQQKLGRVGRLFLSQGLGVFEIEDTVPKMKKVEILLNFTLKNYLLEI